MTYEIYRDNERYEGTGRELPFQILAVDCTLDQALELAFRLSSYYPGCDGLFYVVEE